MKNYSMNPTDENIIEMFHSDAIGRNKELIRFINLLDAIDDCCSIALNGEWGSGKTFFVKQIKLILDYNNHLSDMDDETRKAVKRALLSFESNCNQNNATVYYDAWANDNAEDPILSLLYTVIKNNQASINQENTKDIFEIVASIAEVVTGRNISNLHEKAKGADFFESIKNEENIQQQVRNFVNALIVERANRLVVFIDELDRCKPEYAMGLLERIKHYFDDERIIFVFSVNLSQLQHTAKSYYGLEFDAARYLDKFFDLRISLPEINYDTYFNKRFSFMLTSYIYDIVCIDVIKYFRFSLRETERYIRLVRIANRRDTYSGDFSEEKANNFALMYFVPIVIGLSMTNIEAYTRFITGVDSGPLCEILLTSEREFRRSWLLDTNECFSEENKSSVSGTVVNIQDRINDVYLALFPKIPYHYRRGICVGQMEFSPMLRNSINEIISLLSPKSDYEFE